MLSDKGIFFSYALEIFHLIMNIWMEKGKRNKENELLFWRIVKMGRETVPVATAQVRTPASHSKDHCRAIMCYPRDATENKLWRDTISTWKWNSATWSAVWLQRKCFRVVRKSWVEPSVAFTYVLNSQDPLFTGYCFIFGSCTLSSI